MNEISVELLKSVGEVYFGMDRDEVRKILGDYTEFKKSRISKNTTDDFGICHVYYDLDNKCTAVELFDDVTIKVSKIITLPKAFDSMCEVLKSMDESLIIEEDSCTSIKLSIGVFALENKVETVLFGKEGYYKI